MTAAPDEAAIAAEILRQIALCGAARSISPSEVAQALAGEDWRRLLGAVRCVAVGLQEQGRIDILRKGRAVSAYEVRGVIRLRLRRP